MNFHLTCNGPGPNFEVQEAIVVRVLMLNVLTSFAKRSFHNIHGNINYAKYSFEKQEL